MTMSKISCFLNKDMSNGERVRYMQVSAKASDSVFVTIFDILFIVDVSHLFSFFFLIWQ